MPCRAGGSGRGAAPVAAPGESTPQTNVQEADVDEPDWVKASGSTVFVARGGKLVALDASGDRARVLGSIELGGYGHELLLHGDRALVIGTEGFGGIAAQAGAIAPAYWLGRTRLFEVDVSDPRSMRVLRTLDVEGYEISARLTG